MGKNEMDGYAECQHWYEIVLCVHWMGRGEDKQELLSTLN